MATNLKEFYLNAGDIQFLLDQVTFPTIKVVGYDNNGNPIYGYVDSAGGTHTLGLVGTFDPTTVIYQGPVGDPRNGLPLYNGPRDYQGLRNVSGVFNNLIAGQNDWGATGSQFMRLVNADYGHYSKEVIDLGGVDIATPYATHTTTISNQTAPVHQTVSTPYGNVSFDTWTQDVTTTDSSVTVAYGHHQTVNTVTTSSSSDVNTGVVMVQDGSGTHVGVDGTHTTVVNPTTVKLTGGELDTTTTMTFADGSTGAAHTFNTTNGVTTAADYSDPTKSVVDYTPRMITQTVSSHDALDKLGIATDTATYDVIGANGAVTQNYTETFIENTNSYAADPSYSGWFVLFGQFFDHGLDFISKPGGGPTIQIALAVDDPLYGQIGPDGKPTTSITISRATVDSVDGKGPEYVNHTSPYIDQSQSYGSDDQITLLLREWVKDPNTGAYRPGANLLDGHTVEKAYLSTAFTDQSGFNANGQGLTNRTLPTLNELRAHLAQTGRDDLSWEDISNYRIRDANGKVMDFDLGTTGVQSKGSGEPILLDMNPHFDAAHLSGSNAGAAIAALNSSLGGAGTLSLQVGGPHDGELHLNVPAGPGAGDYYGAAAMAPWFDFATNSIATTLFNAPGMPALTDAQHAAAGELALEAVGDHYIAGDGRANENFGLTTVHHVFHEEHNIELINLETTILGGMFDSNVDKAKGYDWMVKVAQKVGDVVTASGHIESNTASYTGATYDFAGLSYNSGLGTYVADITNIRDARGNIIMDGASPLTVHGIYTDSTGHVSWDVDKMFSATKLMVEMEYQHVAIDQYARFVTPDLPEFVTYDANINADISLEYAQAAFRFGHSQLRETIDAIETQGADGSFDVTGAITHYALSAAFLNPGEFAEVGPGAIALGMTHQVGNETDEFVTPALQQSLLGQPLDLAAINIARGRDLGIPTLNEVRKQLYDALVAERANTNGPSAAAHAKIQLDLLKPYNSWNEFGNSMIHSESLVNFVAAYSFDGDVAHAKAVIDADLTNADVSYVGQDGMAGTVTAATAHDFMSGTRNPDGTIKVAGADGFNSVDLWIGGLAESHVLGGILGPTFNAIFEDQMERLMDGDRFYYLYRLFGALPQITNLNTQITNEQFKDLVERTTGVTHLNGDIMLYADSYIELGQKASAPANAGTEHKYGDTLDAFANAHTNLDGTKQGVYSSGGGSTGGNGNTITIADPEHPGQFLTFINDVRPDSPDINSNGNPTYGYNSHEVLAGTDYNDYLDSGDGDDTVYGGKGNDILVGNGGSDHLYGEDGNDVLYGAGGTAGADVADFLDGGAGDDYIYGGQNAGATEVLIGGKGNDHIYGEAGIDEIYGDDGNDYIDAGGDTDLAFGGAGNDEMYGGEGPDELHGGLGDDLVSGGSGTDKLIGEEGDDILFGGQGGGVAQGDSDELIGGDQTGNDSGFDLADYSDSSIKFDVAADLNNQNLQGAPGGVGFEPFNHFYMGIDGIVGTKLDDAVAPTAATTENPRGNPYGAGLVGDDNGNWLIGGSGNDKMQGEGGNDVVVGGSIKLKELNDFLGQSSIGFAQHFLDLQATRPNFVLGDDVTNANKGSDTAAFTGNLNEYKLEGLDKFGNVIVTLQNGVATDAPNADLANVYAVRVTDSQATRSLDGGVTTIPGDGTDILIGVDNARFANTTINNILAYLDKAPTLDLNRVSVALNVRDQFGSGNNAYGQNNGSVSWNGNWQEANDGNGSSANGQIARSASSGGVLQFGGGDGAEITRQVGQAGATPTSIVFDLQAKNGIGANETLTVLYSSDGVNFTALQTFGSADLTGTKTISLASQTMTADSAIRFAVSSLGNGDYFRIDNVQVNFSGDNNGTGYTTNYTEQLTPSAIASTPLITDLDGTTIASATITIRAADVVAGDQLNVGALPAGVTASGNGTGAGGLTGATKVTLSGAASHAAYQAALAAITFSNPTNDNPTNADRRIDVTVNDGFKDSNLATTTVHFAPVDDPTVPANDSIITNLGTTVSIADWLLLANDVDPDGNVSIASVNTATSGTVSHAGSTVTFNDSTPLGGSFKYHTLVQSGPDPTVSITNLGTGTANLTGTSAGEILLGNGNANVLTGGGGNDNLDGGGGTDTAAFTGTLADYAFSLDSGGRLVINDGVANRDGTDTLANIERATFNGSGYSLNIGTNGNNTFTAHTAVADRPDLFFGFGGTDTVSYSGSAAVTANLQDSSLNAGGAAGDRYYSIENLTGSGNADSLTGDANANALSGGGGNDTLKGGAGNDTLDGGANTDTAVYSGSVLAATFGNSGGFTVTTAADGTDTLTNVENLTFSDGTFNIAGMIGNGSGNTINGTSGADLILGFGNNDTLTGNGGNDVIDGGTGADTAVYGSAIYNYSIGFDTAGRLLVSGSSDGSDTLINVENLRFNGTTYSVLADTAGTNTLTASNGQQVLIGGAGNDTFVFGTAGSAGNGATRDFIADFTDHVGATVNDVIDLTGIDASTAAGFQHLGFNGNTAAAGNIWLSTDANGNTIVNGDVNGNTTADFQILLKGSHSLSALDFHL